MSPGDLEDTDNIVGNVLIGSDNTHMTQVYEPHKLIDQRKTSSKEAATVC